MTIASINPATGELLRAFRALDDSEIDAALARAAGAFRVNSARSFRDRAQRMTRAAELLESRAADYGRTMTLEMGKPIGAAVAEVKKCALVCRYAAPALMAGNVGLLKHSSNVPQSALAIEEIFRDAGFDAHEFQTLLIGSEQVARVLEDDRVKAVTLTG